MTRMRTTSTARTDRDRVKVQAGGVQAWRSPTRCRATLHRRSTRATRTESPLRARPWCWPRVWHYCWPPPAGTKLLPLSSCVVSQTATNPLFIQEQSPGGGADATREAPRTKVKTPRRAVKSLVVLGNNKSIRSRAGVNQLCTIVRAERCVCVKSPETTRKKSLSLGKHRSCPEAMNFQLISLIRLTKGEGGGKSAQQRNKLISSSNKLIFVVFVLKKQPTFMKQCVYNKR
uniref:(northern house mosquito) hypothetical protein n=1 Tax=Culex pipiens TaxID=7175 RepID=A0A8D8JZV0_CULPI